MALNRIECPECGAGLKSPTGFTAGQDVECPKCESTFTVEQPAYEEVPEKKKVKAVASRVDDDDEDEAPKKKKKKKSRDDDGERSYKTSPARFAVLGVLVVVMIGLGIMLVMKWQNDKEADEHNAKVNAGEKQEFVPPPLNQNGVKLGGGGGAAPPPPPPPLLPGGVQPKTGVNTGIIPKNNPPKGPTGGNGMFAETPFQGSPEATQLIAQLQTKLIGTWEGTGPDGATHKVSYQASGQFTHEVNGQPTSGTWQAVGLVGGKVLKIKRGNATLKVVFEGSELLHDTETPGVTLVLKKK